MPTASDVITLSSDFGSPYPAAMKGVLLDNTAAARLVDVSHQFPRQNVRAAAFWLREILPWFPPAVHLVVVDPGVGTDRAAISVRAGEHALVGPDNGVLDPVARELADGEPVEVFEIAVDEPASSTFHGRDVFAPAAARVHEAGIDRFDEQSDFTPVDEYATIEFPTPTVEADRARGEVLVVDGFGNVITNLPGRIIEARMGESIRVNGVFARVARSYAEVDPGHRLVTIGSHGNVELAVNQGRGDDVFGVRTGNRITLTW